MNQKKITTKELVKILSFEFPKTFMKFKKYINDKSIDDDELTTIIFKVRNNSEIIVLCSGSMSDMSEISHDLFYRELMNFFSGHGIILSMDFLFSANYYVSKITQTGRVETIVHDDLRLSKYYKDRIECEKNQLYVACKWFEENKLK